MQTLQRRMLPSLDDHMERPGAFATKWEGWTNPRKRSLPPLRYVRKHPLEDAEELDEQRGVYSILYRAGPESYYVAYIGCSGNLRKRLMEQRNRISSESMRHFRFTAVYVPNSAVALAYEDDLIRYYAPPWNVRFNKGSQ